LPISALSLNMQQAMPTRSSSLGAMMLLSGMVTLRNMPGGFRLQPVNPLRSASMAWPARSISKAGLSDIAFGLCRWRQSRQTLPLPHGFSATVSPDRGHAVDAVAPPARKSAILAMAAARPRLYGRTGLPQAHRRRACRLDQLQCQRSDALRPALADAARCRPTVVGPAIPFSTN
jgi:hypothetical protein